MLENYDYADIADAAEWEGDATEFVTVLITCDPKGGPGYLDVVPLLIHDWHVFIG